MFTASCVNLQHNALEAIVAVCSQKRRQPSNFQTSTLSSVKSCKISQKFNQTPSWILLFSSHIAEKMHLPIQNTAANLFNILRHSLLNCVKSEKFQSSFHQKAARERKLPRSELWPPKMWKSDCVLASHLLAFENWNASEALQFQLKTEIRWKNLISSRHFLLCLQI